MQYGATCQYINKVLHVGVVHVVQKLLCYCVQGARHHAAWVNAERGQRQEEVAGLSCSESFAYWLKQDQNFGSEPVQVLDSLLLSLDSMADVSCCPGLGQPSQDGSQVDVVHA